MEEVTGIHDFGTLEEFGLGSSDSQLPLVGAVIPREKLSGLYTEQQDTALALFEKYQSIFAENNLNMGCINNTLHYIDTGDEHPIWLRPISVRNIPDINQILTEEKCWKQLKECPTTCLPRQAPADPPSATCKPPASLPTSNLGPEGHLLAHPARQPPARLPVPRQPPSCQPGPC
ncbi:hypothetical protein DSO57_1013493 [Entomophthora muscae]|uniref:Uncharacterized protein n=1 Tax=Entomophthora muscae TaxID=34485 RepID=A0ACC2SV43_9FUNG|nr:hypothetical protein DSO57_1013493 [Entomophthora muscae]